MAFEDDFVFAVTVEKVFAAVDIINRTASAKFVRQIVPVDGGFCLVFKADSGIRGRIEKEFPNSKIHYPTPNDAWRRS